MKISHGWWLCVSLRTWQQRDLNQTYMWQWVSRQHGNTGISIKHTWGQWVSRQHGNKGISNNIKQSMIENYISHQDKNKIPHQTSNMDLYNIMHLGAKRQRSTWSHCIYLTSWSYLKKRMIRSWILFYHQSCGVEYPENDCSHIECWHLQLHFEKWSKNIRVRWKIWLHREV